MNIHNSEFITQNSFNLKLSKKDISELGKALYSALCKMTKSQRIVAAYHVSSPPSVLTVKIVIATENRFRVVSITHKKTRIDSIDVWDDPRIVGILSNLDNKSVHECFTLEYDAEPVIRRWFRGARCRIRRREVKADKMHPVDVIRAGFEFDSLKPAKLPIYAIYNGKKRRITCEWEIEVPFILHEVEKAYIPGMPTAIGEVVRIGDEDVENKGVIVTSVILLKQ